MTQQSFGPLVRRLREAKGISLRKFAAQIGKTPTYLSKIEREELPPPAEPTLRIISRLLDLNEEDMLVLAGRIPADLPIILRNHPREMTPLLRMAARLSTQELRELTERIESELRIRNWRNARRASSWNQANEALAQAATA